MKTIIQTVKGARDFYPEDMAMRSWIYQHLQKVSSTFGYQEYDGPFLEKIDLYAAKSGEELVKEQAFVFSDRGGELITLRPELTPSLARMIAQRQNELAFPARWWSFGPFWRYERPQKGRSREFFQWNIDLIGANSAEADAEIVAIGATLFNQLGLKPDQVSIWVNNRHLIDSEFERLEIPQTQRQDVLHLIDRRDKMTPGDWEKFAVEIGLTKDQFEGIKSILADDHLWERSEELCTFFQAIKVLGVADYVRFSPSIIRGLDYYTGTVFEARDQDGEFRAILGGGRYDNLVKDVGGEPLSGVGFAMGDMVVSLVLKKYGCVPAFTASPAPILVTIFDRDSMVESMNLATQLRQSGLKINLYPDVVKLQKQLKFADRMGFRFVIIIGPDEVANGQLAIKDLSDRQQWVVSRAEAVQFLKEKLAEGAGLC